MSATTPVEPVPATVDESEAPSVEPVQESMPESTRVPVTAQGVSDGSSEAKQYPQRERRIPPDYYRPGL